MALFDFASSFITNTFIFQNFIPFIILFALLWGLMSAISSEWFKFGKKVNLVISLGIALTAAYTNPWILAYIAALGSYAAVVMFGLLFVFGVVRWGLGRGRDIYYDTASRGKREEHLIKELENWQRKFEGAPEGSKQREEIAKKMKQIESELDVLKRENSLS